VAAATLPRGLLLISLAALLLPLASALTITDFRITANSFPVIAISPSHEQQVDISFTTDTSVSFVLLNLSSLHGDPRVAASYTSTRVELSRCAKNATTGTAACTLKLLIRPANATARITYQLWSGGKMSSGELTQTFTLDNTAPAVERIATQACNQTQCYIGNGLPTNITVTLQDSDGTFNRRLIFYQLGSTAYTAEGCAGSSCTGRAKVSCTDGASLDLKVVSANGVPSQDDAGNPVTNPGQPIKVICDARPPQIITVSANGSGPVGVITADGQLLVHALVKDRISGVSMAASTAAVQNNVSANTTMRSQCSLLKDGTQECILAVGNLKAGKSLSLPLVFTDSVGNTVTRKLTIPSIYKVGNKSVTPDFFSAKAAAVLPGMLNRATLSLALENAVDYPLYITYQLQQLSTDAAIVNQRIDVTTCQVALTPIQSGDLFAASAQNWSSVPALFSGDRSEIAKPWADWREQNRADLLFLDSSTADWKSDLVLVKCNLSLAVRRGNVYYPQLETETLYWPVRLRESKLGNPGQAFLSKIDRTENEVDSGLNRLIGYADKTAATFTQLCNIEATMELIEGQGLGIEGVGIILMPYIGPALAKGGNGLWNAVMAVSMPYWMGKLHTPASAATDTVNQAQAAVQEGADEVKGGVGGQLRKICKMMYCTDQGTIGGLNWLAPSKNETSYIPQVSKDNIFSDYLSNLNQPDAKNSLLMSLATQCWPGVVYNLNKYRQIDCGYLQCLKDNAYYGDSVTPCELGKSVKLCRFVTNEAFELPYVRVFKNLAANTNQLIQAPLSLVIKKVQSSVCAGADQEVDVRGFFCQLMKTLAKQKDFSSVTSYNTAGFSYPVEADLCDKALCKRDACQHPEKSFIAQLAPGSNLPGEYGRQQAQDRQQRATIEQNLPGELKNWSGTKLTPSMWEYGRRNYLNSSQTLAFFTYVKGQTCDPPGDSCGQELINLMKQGHEPTNAANYNLFLSQPASKEQYSQYQMLTSVTQRFGAKGSGASYDCSSRDINSCYVVCGQQPAQAGPPTPECNRWQQDLNTWKSSLTKTGKTACYSGGQWLICPANQECNNNAGTATGCSSQQDIGVALNLTAQKAKLEKVEKFNKWVDAIGTVAYNYLRERGQLDALFLSGWGSWGKQVSTTAAEYLDPEQWKTNLCNPNGAFSDYTEESGSVYTFQAQTYRPVLTFAAEVLPADGRFIYTVSVTAVSPYYDNGLNVTLEPGGRAVFTNLPMPTGERLQRAIALNGSVEYKQVCVSFGQSFPEAGKPGRYCRAIQPNAFSRGSPTNGTMPDFGVQDPYQNAPTTSAQGGLGGGTT